MSFGPSEKIEKFQSALQLFLERLEQDKTILAAILVGSISEETIWRKESIGMWIIEKDGGTRRLRSDGDDPDVYRTLVEVDINFHVQLIPRSKFKQMVEGSSRTTFNCNFFEHRELIYCADPSIENWFTEANEVATRDQEKELLATTSWTIHACRYSRKLFEITEDLELTKQTLISAAYSLSALDIIQHGEVCEDLIIYRAIEYNPKLFQIVYLDVLTKRKTKKLFRTALERVEQYLDENAQQHLKPLLNYLTKQQRLVPLSEISDHFAYTQLYPWHLESMCEWLHQKSQLEKVSARFRLTSKSRIDVEEPAYFLDA